MNIFKIQGISLCKLSEPELSNTLDGLNTHTGALEHSLPNADVEIEVKGENCCSTWNPITF